MRPFKDQSGVALPLALFLLAGLTGLLVVFVSMGGTDPAISANLNDTTRARYAADAGIDGHVHRQDSSRGRRDSPPSMPHHTPPPRAGATGRPSRTPASGGFAGTLAIPESSGRYHLAAPDLLSGAHTVSMSLPAGYDTTGSRIPPAASGSVLAPRTVFLVRGGVPNWGGERQQCWETCVVDSLSAGCSRDLRSRSRLSPARQPIRVHPSQSPPPTQCSARRRSIEAEPRDWRLA